MANINNIVRVNATIQDVGLIRRDFGRTLFVTTDATLGQSNRVQVYADFSEVAEVFATTTEPYIAANAYFQQIPFPKNLLVGRWFNTASAADLLGGTLPPLATITAINDGALNINGADVTGLDFTADANYTAVAATLEAALTGITVAFDALTTSLTLTTTATGAAATLTFASAPASGTDVSAILALTSSTATRLDQGVDAETIEQAMEALIAVNSEFYFITLDDTFKDTQTVIDLATWVSTRAYMYFAESSDAATLVAGESASIFAQLFSNGAGSDRVAGDWTPASSSTSLQADYLSISSAARLGSVNFSASNSLINPKFKSRPGVEPSNLNTSQQNELDRKRVNYYTPVGGGTVSPNVVNIYQEGTTFRNGIWQDIRFGVDWLVNAIQVDVFNFLVQSGRVQQTDSSSGSIITVLTNVLEQGVRNGLLAGGTLNPSTTADIITTTGNTDFDGTLPNGFLVYAEPYSQQSASDRNQRLSTVFHIWCKGSGAVNFVDIELLFEQ